MQLRERHSEPVERLHGAPSGNPSGGDLEAVRQAGEELYQAGDEVINQAMSRDSLAFLQATRQEGGQ